MEIPAWIIFHVTVIAFTIHIYKLISNFWKLNPDPHNLLQFETRVTSSPKTGFNSSLSLLGVVPLQKIRFIVQCHNSQHIQLHPYICYSLPTFTCKNPFFPHKCMCDFVRQLLWHHYTNQVHKAITVDNEYIHSLICKLITLQENCSYVTRTLIT